MLLNFYSEINLLFNRIYSLAQNENKIKSRAFVCDIISNHLFCACICECEHDEISTRAKNLRSPKDRVALFIFVSFICLLPRAAFVASVTYSSYKSRRSRKRILTKLKRQVLLLPIVLQFIPLHSCIMPRARAHRGKRRRIKGIIKGQMFQFRSVVKSIEELICSRKSSFETRLIEK